MKIMQIDAKVGRAETEAAEMLVLAHCEGERLNKQDTSALDKALGGSLNELLQSKEFEGRNTGLSHAGQGAVETSALRRPGEEEQLDARCHSSGNGSCRETGAADEGRCLCCACAGLDSARTFCSGGRASYDGGGDSRSLSVHGLS